MEEYGFKGFGVRRKRQIDLSAFRQNSSDQQSSSLGIDWDSVENDEQLEQQIRQEKMQLGRVSARQPATMSSSQEDFRTVKMGGKDIVIRPMEKKADFQKDCGKLTIYLENNLISTVKELKKERYIESISKLVGDALVHYLSDTNKKNTNPK